MTIRRRLATYCFTFAALSALWLASPAVLRPPRYSVPAGKVVDYLGQRDRDQMLFVGDSRTFTDIQPRVIDPILRRKSYNLATFGLWLPPQYLEFQDVFPKVPRNTVIVWSLSHHNFLPVGDRWWIPGQYRFGLRDAAEYILDGYSLQRVFQEYREAPFSPFDSMVRFRKRLLSAFEAVSWRTHWTTSIARPRAWYAVPVAWNQSGSLADANRAERNKAVSEKLLAELSANPDVAFAAPVSNDGVVNSVESVRKDGGYDRIIIDREFFREQQSRLWPPHAEDPSGCHLRANEVYMKTFNKILGMVSEYHLKVVVNYIEDAPGSWMTETERTCARQFMNQQIAPLLKQHDVELIAPDFYPQIGSSNDWYFDNSHLATEGAGMYSRFLAEELERVLVRRGW